MLTSVLFNLCLWLKHSTHNVVPNFLPISICTNRIYSAFSSHLGSTWLFAHEVGHCLGGHHLRPKHVQSKTRTNFGFCPPNGNYGTIEAYEWRCPNGINGNKRKKAYYFSNPNVFYERVATGDANNNNAAYMTTTRFTSRDLGTNCLDGRPDDDWNIGFNCNIGQTSYEPPINYCEGINLFISLSSFLFSTR